MPAFAAADLAKGVSRRKLDEVSLVPYHAGPLDALAAILGVSPSTFQRRKL